VLYSIVIITPTYARLFLGCATAFLFTASTLFATGRVAADGSLRVWSANNRPIPVTSLLTQFGLTEMIVRGELIETPSLAPAAGYGRIVYQQHYQGLPVIGGRIVIRTDRDGLVTGLYSSLARLSIKSAVSFDVSRSSATEAALQAIPSSSDLRIARTDKALLPRDGGIAPVWVIVVRTTNPVGLWEVLVDAADGTVASLEDRLGRFDGRGLVFDPDPKSATGDSTLTDQNDSAAAIPEEAYTEATLLDISQNEDTLYVLSGPNVDTSPTANRAVSVDGDFRFDREDDRFEEVMAYFHLDRQARYIASLGFADLPPNPIYVNVNGIQEDVSFYDPESGVITTGIGGVDDAEDADVLIHEYTHALIERILPEWRGDDTPLLTEGLSDYFAGDGSYDSAPDYNPNEVYTWDGHNEFWAGRILNADYHYPEDADRERHDAGQLWSGTLFEVRKQAGDRDAWNQVVLDHLFSLADSTTVPDAADALLESDLRLTGGRFRAAILRACEQRGILPAEIHHPRIFHEPLKDTEALDESRDVAARIESELPLDTGRTALIFAFDEEDPDTVYAERDQFNPDRYLWAIPGPGREATARYYFVATDSAGVFATLPANAPEDQFTYFVGPDHVPPVILSFDPIPETVFINGNIRVRAVVSDNLGVGRVVMLCINEFLEICGGAELECAEENSEVFTGRLVWDVFQPQQIKYHLIATDVSANENQTITRGAYFSIQPEALIDDFESDYPRWDCAGWNRSSAEAFRGEWSLWDRTDSSSAPREAITAPAETWNFAGLRHARLLFTERHLFDRRVAERGVVEVCEEGSETYREVADFIGWSGDWMEQEIDLDRYAANNAPSIQVRFRSITPERAAPLPGWFIDNVRLRVGNIVDIPEEKPVQPFVSFLSEPFPNPTNGGVQFYIRTERGGSIELLELSGRRVLALPVPVGASRGEIDMSKFPSGIYYLKAPEGTLRNSKRIVLVR